MFEVKFKNWISGSTSNHPLILIRGTVVCTEGGDLGTTSFSIQCSTFRKGMEQCGSLFKLIHPLKEGMNEIIIEIVKEGNIIGKQELLINYEPLQMNYKVKFFYVTAQDEPCRNYDGYDIEIEKKKNLEGSFLDDSSLSSIELAKDKIGVAGLLLQTAFHETITKHNLECMVSKPLPNGITFHSELSDTFPKRGGLKVEHLVLPLNQKYCETLPDHELYQAVSRYVAPQNDKTINVIIMGMTRWDVNSNSKLPLAHTALGGFPVALFGSGNIHTWPCTIDQVLDCFKDATKIPNTVFNDSGGRDSYWANASTGIGAVFHEIGHSFKLRHTKFYNPFGNRNSFNNPCMGRGFDAFNRIFTLSEPSNTSSKFYLDEKLETNLHPHSVLRLLFNPFFSSSIQNSLSLPAPLIEKKGGILLITSAVGIAEISFYNMKHGDILFSQSLAVFPPISYSLSIPSIKKLPHILEQDKFIGCSVMDINGNITEEIISLKISFVPSSIPLKNVSKPDVNVEKSLRIGSHIRLMHVLTGQYLQSYPINYSHPNSSFFQQVTCVDERDKDEIQTEWKIVPVNNTMKEGDIIHSHQNEFTLQHIVTGQFLHSHSGHPSPLTNQQEACCVSFEDYNNHWVIHPKNSSSTWIENEPVMLFHVNTSHYLHSHGGFTSEDFTFGCQEVTCWPHKTDDNNYFIAEICT